MTSRYAKLSVWLIGAWLAFALVASSLHVFESGTRPPLAMGISAVIPIALFLAWFAASRSFRDFTLSLSPKILTLVQSWRVIGFAFLVLAAYGILPRAFALSAGWGDLFIGGTAISAALTLARPEHRRAFVLWQFLGIADLLNAVAFAALSGVIDPHGIPATPMTLLPLSLVPSFGVPLFLILHIICIAQALRWPARDMASVSQGLHSPAA